MCASSIFPMGNSMEILLTFVGNNDCHLPEKTGPIIQILEQLSFDRVYLFYNDEKYLPAASKILKYSNKHFPATEVHYAAALSSNPIDYNTVYPAIYNAIHEIKANNPSSAYTVSLTSGTPTMHTCWIFIVQGGVLPAKLIQVSRESGIAEVSFSLDDFPAIKSTKAVKVELTKLARENKALKNRLGLPTEKIIGESPQMLKAKQLIHLYADTDISIHINGETGTGKELVAEALHYLSKRQKNPFVPINCGAIPTNLFESEFFGYKRGAFTGAVEDRQGLLLQADGGTLFLDEIGELTMEMQSKLLRVLQQKEFHPVGSNKMVQSQFRLISASNKDLRGQVRNGYFREDLFYRIVTAEILLPPLRERGDDKILIAKSILEELNKRNMSQKIFTASCMEKITNSPWPGNVRQLRHAIEAAFAFPDKKIEPEYLQIIDVTSPAVEVLIPPDGIDLENEVLPRYYHAAMERCGGNAEKAARLLMLAPHTFRARLRKLDRSLSK